MVHPLYYRAVAVAVAVVVAVVAVVAVVVAVAVVAVAVVVQPGQGVPFQLLPMMKFRWNLGKMNSRCRRNPQNQVLRVVPEVSLGIAMQIHP